jgi:hypothetical protein
MNSTSLALSALCALGARNTPRPGTRAKYIIVNRMGLELAIIVPEPVNHSDAINLNLCRPISAGFYWINEDNTVRTDGRSTSLQLCSRPEDADIIQSTLHLIGLL